MCGINGIFLHSSSEYAINREELLTTRDHMYHRGPDGSGVWISDCQRIGFGHRRLAIIELSELGAQPMSIENKQIWITFNGEIYNHQELRLELESRGARFRGHSDTEVLLQLYKYHGLEMFGKLRGMFALAIWDNRIKKLFLARDPYGIKPLYYCNTKGIIRFASQVKALLAGGFVAPDIDPAGAISFLLWGSISEPLTLYENIQMLPAGQILEIDQKGKFNLLEYWNIKDTIDKAFIAVEKIPVNESMEYAIDAIRDSVRSHIIADVPVGSFLSAGLDSATITGLANELSNHPVESITLGFKEFKGKDIDELPGALEIAKILDVNHHIISTSLNEIGDELPLFLSAMDQPTIDGLNTWLVSKAANQTGLKVVLSGLGGDELLGGYSTFQNIPATLENTKQINSIPFAGDLFFYIHKFLAANSKLNPKRSGYYTMGNTLEGAYQLERSLFMPWHLDKIIDKDFANSGLLKLSHQLNKPPTNSDSESNFCKIVQLESSRYMRNQLLRDTDWIGMSHSLEIRVPLVDHILLSKLVGLAAIGRLGIGKSILPNSLTTHLPNNILNRPKTGFTVPIWRWLNNSPHFSGWKKNAFLRKKNTLAYNRWSYCLLEQYPEIKDFLK